MANLKKQGWETKPVAEERVQEEEITDMLINEMIDELDIADIGTGNEAVYNNLSIDERNEYDLKAYQFFAILHNTAGENNSIIKDLEFENYIKIERPEDIFNAELHDGKSLYNPNSVGYMWNNIYGANTNLFKASALNGRMMAIAAASNTQQT